MKHTPILTIALLTVIMIPAVQQVYAAASTIDGVVSDSMCGKKHMLSGKTDAECVQKCLKGKASYALVVGDKVYTLIGKSEAIAPFAAQRVHVKGSVKGHIITVDSVDEIKATAMPDMSGMPM